MWNRYSIINEYEHFLVVDKHGRVFGKFPNIYQAEKFLKYCYTCDYDGSDKIKSKDEIRAEKLCFTEFAREFYREIFPLFREFFEIYLHLYIFSLSLFD